MTTTAPAAVTILAAVAPRFRTRLATAMAQAGLMTVVGAVSGLFALGAGSRLAMRLMALSSGAIGTGIRPDSGAIPGEITLDGTMFLLLAGVFAGAVFAVMVATLLQRWLPTDRRRGAVVVGLTSFAPGLLLVNPGNPDFVLFGPAGLAVVLFAACALGYGLLVARLSERWHAPEHGAGRWLLGAMGAAGLVAAIMAMGSTGLFGLTIAAPIALLLFAQVIVARDGRLRWWFGGRVQRSGEWLLVGMAVASLGGLGWRAWRILAGSGAA